MLSIRKEQLEAFEKVVRTQFREKMVLYLRERFVEQTAVLSADDLRTLIDSEIKRAKQFKVILEDDVQRYLECIIIYGRDFDSNPKLRWVRATLRARNITGTEKMDFIDKQRKQGA